MLPISPSFFRTTHANCVVFLCKRIPQTRGDCRSRCVALERSSIRITTCMPLLLEVIAPGDWTLNTNGLRASRLVHLIVLCRSTPSSLSPHFSLSVPQRANITNQLVEDVGGGRGGGGGGGGQTRVSQTLAKLGSKEVLESILLCGSLVRD